MSFKTKRSIRASILGIFSLLMMFAFGAFNQVSAEDGIPFQIVPKLTEGQEEGVTSYFSIKVDGNSKKETLELVLKNTSEETKDIEVKVVDAYTSPNGVVQYSESETENSIIIDDKYKMSTHLKLQGNEIVTLKAGEEKVVRADLDAKDIEGVLLGGFSFQVHEEEEEVDQGDSSFNIDNKVNMVIGVMLQFDGDHKVEIAVDDPYVDPMPAYYAIRLPITMESPSFKNVEIDYEVHLGEQLKFKNKDEFDFAPKTKTNVSIPWESEDIKKGEIYTLSATMSYNDEDGQPQEMKIEKTFKYTPDENALGTVSRALRRPIEEGGLPWVILLLALIPLLLIVWFIVLRRNSYMVEIESGDAPGEINEDHPLYELMEKGSKPKKQGKFGIYRLKKRKGKKKYVYLHSVISEENTNYRIN